MMRTIILLSLLAAVSIIATGTLYENSKLIEAQSTFDEETLKVEFLEDALAQKTLEYEWLSEIANELVEQKTQKTIYKIT